jgi:hypothetical protein
MHWETHIHLPLGGGIEHRPVRVERVIVTEEVGLHVDESTRLAEPFDAPGLFANHTVTGTDRADRVHDGL